MAVPFVDGVPWGLCSIVGWRNGQSFEAIRAGASGIERVKRATHG